MGDQRVQVEIVELGDRTTRGRRRLTAALHERRGDIETAINEATETIKSALAAETTTTNWHVSKLEARFGLTLTTEAGVLVSRMSAEAALEITVSVTRNDKV